MKYSLRQKKLPVQIQSYLHTLRLMKSEAIYGSDPHHCYLPHSCYFYRELVFPSWILKSTQQGFMFAGERRSWQGTINSIYFFMFEFWIWNAAAHARVSKQKIKSARTIVFIIKCYNKLLMWIWYEIIHSSVLGFIFFCSLWILGILKGLGQWPSKFETLFPCHSLTNLKWQIKFWQMVSKCLVTIYLALNLKRLDEFGVKLNYKFV